MAEFADAAADRGFVAQAFAQHIGNPFAQSVRDLQRIIAGEIGMTMTNSSPPRRAITSSWRRFSRHSRAISISAGSPA
ncbi:MAG: hypothetical protein U5N27_05775 [Rhizobium sp.]|nr:hypothetical protein [Rhizobium sp.]